MGLPRSEKKTTEKTIQTSSVTAESLAGKLLRTYWVGEWEFRPRFPLYRGGDDFLSLCPA